MCCFFVYNCVDDHHQYNIIETTNKCGIWLNFKTYLSYNIMMSSFYHKWQLNPIQVEVSLIMIFNAKLQTYQFRTFFD